MNDISQAAPVCPLWARVLRRERGEVTAVAPFVPAPRAVRDIDRQLRHVAARRATVHAIIADSLALLVEIEVEQDSLLELRCAEVARRA